MLQSYLMQVHFFQAAVKTLQYITNESKQFYWNSPVARVGIIDVVRTISSADRVRITVVLPLSASLLSLYCWCYKYLNENSYPETKPKQCPKPENYKPNNISRRVNNQNPKPQSHSSCENKSGNSWSVHPWLKLGLSRRFEWLSLYPFYQTRTTLVLIYPLDPDKKNDIKPSLWGSKSVR